MGEYMGRVNCMGKSCLSSPIFIQEQISFQCQHLVMSSTGNTNPGNFANRPMEEVQEIASKGGQSRGAGDSGGSDETAGTTSATGNTNPGNFANRPKEEVQEIASKGGKASSGSFEPAEKASEAGSKGGSAR